MYLRKVCTVWLILGSSALLAQEYDLDRPEHHKALAGEKHALGIRMIQDEQQHLKVNGREVPTDSDMKTQVELGGPWEAVAVDHDGSVAEGKLVIKFCTYLRNGQATPLFELEDQIIAKAGSPERYVVNGRPARGEQLRMLTLLTLPVGKEGPESAGSTSDSEPKIYSAGHKVKAGETWPINAEAATAHFAKLGVPVRKGAVQGSVTLKSAHPVNGIPCLQVESETRLNAPEFKGRITDPAIKGKKFDMIIKSSIDLPVDATLPMASTKMQMHMESETGGVMEANGEKREVSTHIVLAKEMSMTLMK